MVAATLKVAANRVNKHKSPPLFLYSIHHMPPYKRKRDDYDSDDEEPAFGKQILPVANLPEDFDAPPTDGLQYLFTVRYVANVYIG